MVTKNITNIWWTAKTFFWFTTHSWKYLEGQRKDYFTGFWAAWQLFYGFEKEDRGKAHLTTKGGDHE